MRKQSLSAIVAIVRTAYSKRSAVGGDGIGFHPQNGQYITVVSTQKQKEHSSNQQPVGAYKSSVNSSSQNQLLVFPSPVFFKKDNPAKCRILF